MIAADKLHNAGAILRTRRRKSIGDKVWDRFAPERDEVLWYYRSMTAALATNWEHELHDELAEAVRQLALDPAT